jgi:RimJ/RimL family protein N-acetyltransferase
MAKIEKLSYYNKGKNIIIRNAALGDAQRLVELMKKLDTETTFLLREPEEFTLTVEQEQKFIETKLESQVELFLLAEVDGAIIGSCALNGNTRKRLRHTGSLGIALIEKYWGLGIGRKLMETAIVWAKENGITRVTLEVDTSNYRAISLYTKLGFQVEGTFINDKRLADGSYRNGYAMAILLY